MNGNCTTGTVVETTSFVYDGDGILVKKIKPDGSKTLYVGGIYEVDKNSGGTVTGTKTYYPVAGAMRIGSTLYYVLKDQLGSAGVVTDATANAVIVGEDRFYPFGGTRFTTGTMLTDKLFTGQREMAGLGIYNYGARFYSPKLGRFLSADTITLNPANPQKLNHFSYAVNNPLRYTDPTGHRACDNIDAAGNCITAPGGGGSGFGGLPPKKPNKDKDNPSAEDILNRYSGTTWSDLSSQEQATLLTYGCGSSCWTESQFGGATDISWTLEDWPTMAVAGGLACLGTGLCIPAAAAVVNTGTNTVYRVVQNGRIIYVGITQNFAQRAAYWANTRGWNPEPIRGLSENLSRFDARAVEQVLIEHYGLENLENQINSIAATNPIYQAAIQRGNEILQMISFFGR